ncbi:hypothetical protein IRJ41_018707 [Triplophysa rosa]|uniref:Uncharacterized protein n=1 Tax=Triplophysa rosa TaxID=992332 RepID=A0A9W7T817_TRIRA|nr:hypothetical protein IRJ41_018707 [Triplophysa rosa]
MRVGADLRPVLHLAKLIKAGASTEGAGRSWPSISSWQWGGVGRAIRRGQECSDRSGSTDKQDADWSPSLTFMVDVVTTNDDSLTARPYMQKGKLFGYQALRN